MITIKTLDDIKCKNCKYFDGNYECEHPNKDNNEMKDIRDELGFIYTNKNFGCIFHSFFETFITD